MWWRDVKRGPVSAEGKVLMMILTYSGACCGLSFMSVDPVRRQIGCFMVLHESTPNSCVFSNIINHLLQ